MRAACALALGLILAGCDTSLPPDTANSAKRTVPAARNVASHSLVRAERRAYDGAPPVIPHMKMGADCTACHTATGIQFGEMGFAPPMPHIELSHGLGAFARCEQCHVYSTAKDVFAESDFEPLRQDLRHGRRLNPLAPPTMPHPVFMRENCQACHTGPAAREEIRCPHPERARCRQCHVPATTSGEFSRNATPD